MLTNRIARLSGHIRALWMRGRAALSRAYRTGSPVAVVPRESVQKGISYFSLVADAFSQPSADLALAQLSATGANWISLIVTQYQDDTASNRIEFFPQAPTDEDVRHVIARAHLLGLKVMLKPHVDLRNGDPFSSRSMIGFGFNPSQWADWFASYRDFIYHYAELAQACGADQFCAGTELDVSIGRAAEWRDVMRGVRSRFGGPLTYACSWTLVPFLGWWDAVDLIGVDAYPPLSLRHNPSVPELRASWRLHVAVLDAIALAWRKPILFTEIGYRSMDWANVMPWDWWTQRAVDLEEQADCYQAAFRSVFRRPWFAGMFWWAWGVDPFEGGPSDSGFTPHDKPAEDVLRRWYGAPPRAKASAPNGPQAAARRPDDSLRSGSLFS